MNISLIDIYHEFHFEVLEKIKKKSHCHFSYAILGTEYNFHGDVKKIQKISKNIFDQNSKIETVANFIFPSKLSLLMDYEWTLDDQLIREVKHIESYFLRLTDRNTAYPISVHERRQYYLILLNYFNYIIKSTKIDSVIAFDTPHSYSSYMYYLLAIHNNIPVMRMEHHFFQNHSLLISKEIPKIPNDYHDKKTMDDLWSMISEQIKKDYNIYNKLINQTNQKEKKALIGKSIFSFYIFFFRFIGKMGANIIMGFFPFLFKRELLHFTSLNEIKSRLIYRLKINKPLFKLIRLNHYYNKISEQPSLSEKYIFYGMHMQPEKTSQPLGKEFDHQLFPITILSKSLPKGWFLYVKEHPNQFNKRKIANSNYRNKEFYNAIKRLKNVKFVSLQVPSSKLIKNSQIVSTLTGTLGWEALTIGKPVLAFGDSYYSPCKAVRSPLSVVDCKKFINELTLLSEEDVTKEVYKYLLFYCENNLLVEASNWESTFSLSDLQREKQIENIATAIQKKLDFKN